MEKLSHDIHMKREEMIHLGLTNGLDNIETIQVSQELDKLILQYQRYKEQQTPKWLAFVKIPFLHMGYKGKQRAFWKVVVTSFMK